VCGVKVRYRSRTTFNDFLPLAASSHQSRLVTPPERCREPSAPASIRPNRAPLAIGIALAARRGSLAARVSSHTAHAGAVPNALTHRVLRVGPRLTEPVPQPADSGRGVLAEANERPCSPSPRQDRALRLILPAATLLVSPETLAELAEVLVRHPEYGPVEQEVPQRAMPCSGGRRAWS
jgi:hypothetical protein